MCEERMKGEWTCCKIMCIYMWILCGFIFYADPKIMILWDDGTRYSGSAFYLGLSSTEQDALGQIDVLASQCIRRVSIHCGFGNVWSIPLFVVKYILFCSLCDVCTECEVDESRLNNSITDLHMGLNNLDIGKYVKKKTRHVQITNENLREVGSSKFSQPRCWHPHCFPSGFESNYLGREAKNLEGR